jgi:hypothetical protein
MPIHVRPTPVAGILLAAAGALCLAASSSVAATQWTITSLAQQLPVQGDFTESFRQRRLSLSTVISDSGNQYGNYVLEDGSVKSFNVRFSSNPAFSVVDSDAFIPLAAGEPICPWGFCLTEWPFGIKLTDTGATTAWLDTATDTSPAPGSLPFSRFPGNFVAENHDGVVASTQLSAEGQFGLVMDRNSGMTIELPDVQWVIDLTSGAEPLVLGYSGERGDCLVYGEGCRPPVCDDDDDDHDHDHDHDHDGHQNHRGRGHREHGRGHGYGHHRDEQHDCDDDHDDDEQSQNRVVAPTPEGAVLIQARSDNSTIVYTFPRQLDGSSAVMTVDDLFPLAMNDQLVVLRGSVSLGDRYFERRLLACKLGETLDVDGDRVIDCEDGFVPLVSLFDSHPVDTVLGFSLNQQGLLTGNYGYSAAGIGTPFVLDTTSSESPDLLSNRLKAGNDWEIHTVTDLNASGVAVGYGYQDCSALPEAFSLYPQTGTSTDALRLSHRLQPDNAAVAPGDDFTPVISVTGGSGDYQYRLSTRQPGDEGWQLNHDWRTSFGAYAAPDDYLGDVCLKLEVRDAADSELSRTDILRVRVSEEDNDAGTPGGPDLLGDRTADDADNVVTLGVTGGLHLLLLFFTGLIRRRP